jgi:hypothetical protein
MKLRDICYLNAVNIEMSCTYKKYLKFYGPRRYSGAGGQIKSKWFRD